MSRKALPPRSLRPGGTPARGVDPALCGERTGECLRETRKVLGADQMGEFRKLFSPSQLMEEAAQSDSRLIQDAVAEGGDCERRRDIQPRR